MRTFILGSSIYLVSLILSCAASAQVTFTGNAFVDFDTSKLTTDALLSWLRVNESSVITPSASMAANGFRSGIDILNVFFQYDYRNDILHVGVDCDGICGDVDGNGNPSTSSDPGAVDQPNFCSSEQLSLMLWPEPPAAWQPKPFDFTYFFPQLIVGVPTLGCLPGAFGAFEFTNYLNCLWPRPLEDPYPAECATQQGRVSDPSAGNGYSFNLTTRVRIN